MLSIKLALELKEAGLCWTPEAGDWFATRLAPTWWLKDKKSGDEELRLLTRQPTENGFYGWSTVDTEPFCELYTHDGARQEENWDYLEKNFIWIPRVDQLIKELALRTKSFHALYKAPGGDRLETSGYWVAYVTADQSGEAPPGDYYAETLEEALGRALLALLTAAPGE